MTAPELTSAPAVVIRGRGGVETLAFEERPAPAPGPGEVAVQVAACGLNRADILQRRGLYPAPPGAPADIPGLEYAGTVAAVGPGVSSVAPGARVMGIVGGGAMATYLVAKERELVPVPDGLSLERAAAIPEVFMTAYDALMLQADVGMDARVLIHAVASGVGTAAVQLARVVGARTIGTSRTESKLARCAELGVAPDCSVHVAEGSFAAPVRAWAAPDGIDAVLDLVGGAYLAENLQVLARRGRIVVVGLVGGISGKLSLATLLAKRAQIIGTVLRSRLPEEKAALAQRFTRAVVPLFVDGRLKPVIDDVLPMKDIAEAHRRMEANETLGKLILRW